MKKLHLTRFAAMATVALMGSTAAWAYEGSGFDEDAPDLYLQSDDDETSVVITTNDANAINSGEKITNIIVQRGAASASFSTLMIPATVKVSESVNVLGGKIKAAYVPTGYHTGDKTLDFTEKTTIEANTPYLVEVDGSPTGFEFRNNAGYTIQPTDGNEHSTTLKNTCWTFTGSYDPIYWETAPTNIYGFAASSEEGDYAGKFVKVGYDVTLLPLRAYLTCTGSGYSNNGLPKSAVEELPEVINVRFLDKNGGTLSIGTMNTRTGDIQMQDRYYDLKGRKLNGKPQNKIMYVNKKVIKH
jgi:hypothetical protein